MRPARERSGISKSEPISGLKGTCISWQLHLCLDPLNKHLERVLLRLVHQLEGLDRFLKLEAVRDQLAGVDLARGDQSYGLGVAARLVANAALDGQGTDARRRDGENDVLSEVS